MMSSSGTASLAPYWEEPDQDLVVLPSLTFDMEELSKIPGVINYEERLLYHVLHLSHPQTRIFYVSSMPLDPEIINYYISLLPSHLTRKDIANRLHLFSVHDPSSHCLAQKLLRRPRLLERIKRELRPERARLQVYRRTMFEKKVADELSLRFPPASPAEMKWGTKSGSRRAFQMAGISHPPGTYHPARTVDDLVEGILDVVRKQGDQNAHRGMVKLDESFAGMGNAVVDLSSLVSSLQDPTSDETILRKNVLQALETMRFESTDESWARFQKGIESIGAIFELFIPQVDGQTTPSAQGYIDEHGRVTILSTHEQVMNGRHYVGCKYPADARYHSVLINDTQSVGKTLAHHGVVGHFGIDYIATPPSSDPQTSHDPTVHALEINLRATGTTFPLLSVLLLTQIKPEALTKHYLTTDHFGSPHLAVLTPGDVPDILARTPYAWNGLDHRGTIAYMMGGVAETGRFGLMVVGDSDEECEVMMRSVEEVFEKEGNKWKERSEGVPEDSFGVLVGSMIE